MLLHLACSSIPTVSRTCLSREARDISSLPTVTTSAVCHTYVGQRRNPRNSFRLFSNALIDRGNTKLRNNICSSTAIDVQGRAVVYRDQCDTIINRVKYNDFKLMSLVQFIQNSIRMGVEVLV